MYQFAYQPVHLRNQARDKFREHLLRIPRCLTPNFFSYLRILLTIPIYFCLGSELLSVNILAFFLYISACITDFIDGALADVRNEHTFWGKLLDPIADKILQGATFFRLASFVFSQYLSLVIVLWANIGIDVATALVAWIMIFRKEKFKGANKFGKSKFGFQCAGVFLAMLYCPQLALVALSLSAMLGIRSAVEHLQK